MYDPYCTLSKRSLVSPHTTGILSLQPTTYNLLSTFLPVHITAMLSTLRFSTRLTASRSWLRAAAASSSLSLFTHSTPLTHPHAPLHTSPTCTLDVTNIISPDNIVRSPFPDIEVPTVSLYNFVYKDFAKYGSKVALVRGETGREYTFNEIDELTSKFSSSLRRHGFHQGDVLAIVSPNLPEYATVLFGTLAAGGAVCTCNPTYSVDELTYQFQNSGSKIVATIPEILDTVHQAAQKAKVEKVIVIDPSDDSSRTSDGILSYQAMVSDSGSLFSPVEGAPDDIAMLPYSSGTTGLPKGVMLTNKNVSSNIQQIEHPELLQIRGEGTCLIGVLPFFHIYGMVVILFSSLHCGSKTVTMSKFDPELFLSCLEKYKVNIGHLVPPLVLFLAKHPLVDNYDLTSLDEIMVGAAPLGGEVVKAARDRINCRLLRQGYGLSETSPVTHLMPQSYSMSKPDSIGHPIRSMLVKIVDPETGKSLGAGEEGELWLTGPNIMKGYLNQPEATRECITEDGWFKSGDVGEQN